jgi:hypothetical protein
MTGETTWSERVKPDGSVVRREVPVIRRHTLSEGFGGFDELRERSLRDNTFVFCGPLSYWGKARTARNAHQLFAFVVDLDGVGTKQLEVLLYYMDHPNIFVPKPSYIVNSGTGIHLYYLLDEPVWTRPSVVSGLQEVKRNLTELCWVESTSTLKTRQYQGIYQGFRMVGTSTKLNGAVGNRKVERPYEVCAFKVSGYEEPVSRWSLSDLVTRVSRNERDRRLQPALEKKMLDLIESGGRVPIEEAKRKWPDWYERRVVNGEDIKGYICNERLYEWYLERMRDDIEEGHRYWGVHFLAAYANKCGIEYERLERDALEILPELKSRDRPGNEFTGADLFTALEFYGGGSASAPARRVKASTIARSTGLKFPVGKRNGRDRKTHAKIMAAIRDIEHPDGSWMNTEGRPKGSPNKRHPKRDAIWEYADSHPGANHSEIARELGVSRTTVIKWMREREGGDGGVGKS